MNTRFLLASSGLLLMFLGVLATFLPDELLLLFGHDRSGAAAVLIQLLGASYFGMGIWLWMSKGAVVGGIYGRPLVVGAWSQFAIGALALLKAQEVLAAFPVLWGLVVLFSLLAVSYGRLFFIQPKG